MHEVKYTDYKLSPGSFQAWLRDTFGDPSIVVECKNGYFVFNLQDGVDLTEDHDLEIYRKLRGYKRWPQ